MSRPFSIAVLCHCCVIGLCFTALPDRSQGETSQLTFETDIQPLLELKCGKCHAGNVRKGDLDLSSIEGIRKGGESGESLLADNLDLNPLWTLVDAGEMPPQGEPQLSAGQRELIRRWIANGARSLEPSAGRSGNSLSTT